jgi:dTDP-4-amino-4,6-dideoxy-D-glucose acyltransferase
MIKASNNYDRDELEAMDFRSIGNNVRIDRSVRLFNTEHISIGNNVRIDCFSLITAGPEGVSLGNRVHIAAGSYVFGSAARVTLDDFSGMSARGIIYTATDDFLEGWMAHPTIPDSYRKVTMGPVYIGKHAIIGCGSVILPNVILAWGTAVGALSLVKNSTTECELVAGIPAKTLTNKRDSDRLRELELRYFANESVNGTE